MKDLLCVKACPAPNPNHALHTGNFYAPLDFTDNLRGKHGPAYLIFREDYGKEIGEYWFTTDHFAEVSDIDETQYADEVLNTMFVPVENKTLHHDRPNQAN